MDGMDIHTYTYYDSEDLKFMRCFYWGRCGSYSSGDEMMAILLYFASDVYLMKLRN